MSFHFAQISDTHLSRDKPYFAENFLRVAAAIRARPPDLVVNTGDLALDGSRNASDLVEARRLHEALELPVRYIAGNHDSGEAEDAPVRGLPSLGAQLRSRYLALFGTDFWSLDVPGWRLLAINSQLLASELAASREQFEFVHAAATTAGDRSIAFLGHKPLWHRSRDEVASSSRFVNPEPRQRLLQTLAGITPKLVLSGHVHPYLSHDGEDGCKHVWGPSTGFILSDARQPRYGRKHLGYVKHVLWPDRSHASEFVVVPSLSHLDIDDFPAAYAGLD